MSDPNARPGYHDISEGFGGAPPTQNPRTPHLVLASVALAMCGLGAAATAVIGATGWCIAFAVLGAIALLDIVVVVGRQHRGRH